MGYLDCEDLETTLSSLSAAIRVGNDKLVQALCEYDESRFEIGPEDPLVLMPRELVETLGTSLSKVGFEGSYYFHGTRLLDPNLFGTHGILPNNQVIEQIWRMLYELVRGERTEKAWIEFRTLLETRGGGHFGSLYRYKTRDSLHGPDALLVRESFFVPEALGSHDYLGCPETIQDIAICYQDRYCIDLEQRFKSASKACIIKFRSAQVPLGAIGSALWYAFSRLRDGNLTWRSTYCFDGEGTGIPPIDIVNIEVVPGIRSLPISRRCN